MTLDETHDPALASWVESANKTDSDFPIQNLPFGVFKRRGQKESARGGVAIGDQILDLAALGVRTGPTLNGLAALGRSAMRKLRHELSRVLSTKSRQRKRLQRYLLPMKQAELLLPVAVGDYTDFFTGIHHATNMGRMLRPDNPLLPNYKWLPIGYHGRASSIVVSGTAVRRPMGQVKPPESSTPVFGPSQRLDYECELGFVVGPGNHLGRPVSIQDSLEHVFGVVLLNDWSARDVQAWEYQPLGPFLAKSFATTASPWIVTMDALEPFRVANPAQSPEPLEYLRQSRPNAYDIALETALRPHGGERTTIARTNFRAMYWTMAQQLAHHTVSGCNVRVGDLMGSGTISGTTPDSYGSLLELTLNGKQPLDLGNGITRAFLEDGDEVIMTGWCQGDGYRVGFGEVRGEILPARGVK